MLYPNFAKTKLHLCLTDLLMVVRFVVPELLNLAFYGFVKFSNFGVEFSVRSWDTREG
jgi:hypothetical protein